MTAHSLHTRVLTASVVVVAFAVAVFGAVTFLAARSYLERSLADTLGGRADLVRGWAADKEAAALAAALVVNGVRADVYGPSGELYTSRPPAPALGKKLADSQSSGTTSRAGSLRSGRVMEERVQLPGGGFAVVGVSRLGTDRAIFLLGLALIVGGCATVAGAGLALTRSVRRALAPIEDIVLVANSIANGDFDRRLPHANPTTDIGRVVVAFNGVLDHLAQALAATRHSDLRSQRFLADAAHQLRRPMAAIQSSAGALLMTTDGLDHEDVLANIVAETARAGSLVRQLLRLARLDAGLDLENERFELCSLVAAELRSLELLNPHLFFRLSGPQNGVWIVADPAAVREALANLLDNARRHARSLVELVVTARCAHVLIEVADDGPGIPRDAVPEVFNRFTTLGDHGGSGLGLPIARQLAKAQGGDLEYVKGRFVLSIPVKETVNGTVA